MIIKNMMKAKVEGKLDRIADIWNDFIWDYKFCSNKIKFNDEVKTNYFGDILGYFQDTLDIVFTSKRYSNFTDKFSFTISFLQAIYIQQDLIMEMLDIFKTGINKDVLEKDPTFYINRYLRNELVGHPINKYKGRLVSSTLFSYQEQKDEIQYLRYHKDNCFKFESKTYRIVEIQARHLDFLEKYLNEVLSKLELILNDFSLELDKLENLIDSCDFKTLLEYVECSFEAIFKSAYVYDKDSLIKIYERRSEHIRYQNFIDKFYKDLRTEIAEKRTMIKDLVERKEIEKNTSKGKPLPKIVVVYTSSEEMGKAKKTPQGNINYYISKLATKRNSKDFDFFGGLLKKICKNNNLVLRELEHMEQNISDEIEYYTSLRLICLELKKE